MAKPKVAHTVGDLRKVLEGLPNDMKLVIWRNGSTVEIGDLVGTDKLFVHKKDPSFMSVGRVIKNDKTMTRMSKHMKDEGEVLVIG